MKIIEYLYVIENNNICTKDGWQVEMYDTNKKEKTCDKDIIWKEIKEVAELDGIEEKNIQYKRKYYQNMEFIRRKIPLSEYITKNIRSKYNYGYRIYILDNQEIKLNRLFRQTLEVAYETGCTIDIGTRQLDFLNTEDFIHQIEAYEQYYFEKKLEIDNSIYTIVVDPELTGLIVHELVGHSFEFDIWSESQYLQKIIIRGEKITNEKISIVDNPKLHNGYGSYEYDDEGNDSFKTYLVKKGIVSDFLRSTKYANTEDKSCNARRISVSNMALVRMSNTYMLPGSEPVDSIIGRIKKGVFFRGGGNCVCAHITEIYPREAYLILEGKIVGALPAGKFYITLLDFFNKIAGISKEFKIYGGGFGGCGKKNQWPLEIGAGGPYLQINDIYCTFFEKGKNENVI